MRLPATAHTATPWRIHEITPDFRLEDVWALPWVDDFRGFVQMVSAGDLRHGTPAAVRGLAAIREGIGRLLGWDDAEAGVGSRVPSLRERLPADLRAATGPAFPSLPFTSLYLIDDEFAAEVANRTMHGVLHLGRVADSSGGGAQMAILVKPNGLLGRGYMAAIKPFRHAIVYPALFRAWERAWRRRRAAPEDYGVA